jgi:hypothetical protein
MGRINQPVTVLDQITALRRELAELRRRISDRLPVTFAVARPQDVPSVTSESFETVWVADLTRTYPRLGFDTIDGCDADTEGEGRLVIAGEVVATWPVAPGLDRTPRGPFTLPADQVRVEIAYRRSAGAGAVHGAVVDAATHV